MENHRPDVCEEDPSLAYLVNVHGTRHVVEGAGEIAVSVAYISSGDVFDGEKHTPYQETDSPNPPTVYGRTKLRGENMVATLPRYWIFRVSVLLGPGKANFVDKGLRKMKADAVVFIILQTLGHARVMSLQNMRRKRQGLTCTIWLELRQTKWAARPSG